MYARFLGAGGVELGSATDDIILDRTAPEVRAATVREIRKGRFRVSFSVTETGSGRDSVELFGGRQRPQDGRQAGLRIKSSAGTVAVNMANRPRWYRVSDHAGNWSSWARVSPAR